MRQRQGRLVLCASLAPHHVSAARHRAEPHRVGVNGDLRPRVFGNPSLGPTVLGIAAVQCRPGIGSPPLVRCRCLAQVQRRATSVRSVHGCRRGASNERRWKVDFGIFDCVLQAVRLFATLTLVHLSMHPSTRILMFTKCSVGLCREGTQSSVSECVPGVAVSPDLRVFTLTPTASKAACARDSERNAGRHARRVDAHAAAKMRPQRTGVA
jgi:hypothetical protein